MVGSKPEKGPETAKKAFEYLPKYFCLKILDNLEHSELLEEVAKADIFIMPSLAEGGNPISLMEGMAMQKPIIASDVGGIRDLIQHGENGLLIRPKDSELLAYQISLLHSDHPLAERLGENARKTVEGFTWDKTMELYSEIYQECINPDSV